MSAGSSRVVIRSSGTVSVFSLQKMCAVVLSIVLMFAALSSVSPPTVQAGGLLKLAAAAAIIRGGPIIPIPIRYPVKPPKKATPILIDHHEGGFGGDFGGGLLF